MILFIAVFVGGMLFEHFLFEKVLNKGAEVYDKLKGLF